VPSAVVLRFMYSTEVPSKVPWRGPGIAAVQIPCRRTLYFSVGVVQ
jgi:hypothetical protein